MTKLLHKPLRVFAIYALIVLLVSIPVYVLVIDFIWTTELDENNWLTLQHTREKLKFRQYSEDEIEKINSIWGELQPGVSITKTERQSASKDSVYEAIRPNTYDIDDEEDRFRGLISYVEINEIPYQLTIETNVEEWDETFMAITVITLLFFVILISGFIILNRRIATKTWKPFYHTLRSLQSFELSKDQSLNLPETNIEEFSEMNHSLEQLVQNNVATYKLQKSFTENASHELQTPIALLKSKLDLLLQEENVTPEISQILSAIEAPLARLSRINKNLLVLAKVENHQYNERESLDLEEYIQSAHSLFEDYLADKNLSFQLAISEDLIVQANSFLLETLLHNLFSNAIRHTAAGGQIHVKLDNEKLSFSNSGIEALDTQHLFERFSMSARNKVSSGLGLSIIKEIAGKYGWKVEYAFERGFHTFSVIF